MYWHVLAGLLIADLPLLGNLIGFNPRFRLQLAFAAMREYHLVEYRGSLRKLDTGLAAAMCPKLYVNQGAMNVHAMSGIQQVFEDNLHV